MKNILKKSLYFFAFVLGGVFFQISCSNSDDEGPNDEPIGKIIYTKRDNAAVQSIWICNLDGSNQTQIPIALPADLQFYRFYSSDQYSTAKLSADGHTVIFTVSNTANNKNYIYSCDIDGGNLRELVQLDTNTAVFVGNVI